MRALRCALLAGGLAIASGLAQAQALGGGSTINLRDFWILAEIVNPKTGERESFRVDCSDQSPILCEGGPDGVVSLRLKLLQLCGNKWQEPIEGWPAFLRAEVGPFYPGIVEYMASGAGGFVLRSQPAPFAELRRKEGFSRRIASTRPDCSRFADSDIRLTMWLVTPAELAERDAAKGKAAPAAPKRKRFRR